VYISTQCIQKQAKLFLL